MGYLVLKHATKKRRPISQTPGELNVSITTSLEGVGLFVSVSEKKWNKAKYIITKFYRILILLHPGLTFV